MQLIHRALTTSFLEKLSPNKVLVLLGARRVGKTVFINQLIKNHLHEDLLLLNGEDMATAEVLSNRRVENYKALLGDKKLLIIDEAQGISEIGRILKLMVDNLPGLKIIVTGSSMFDLSNKLGEPLTGRQYTFKLYPLSQMEYTPNESIIETSARLEERMIFGNYPELLLFNDREEKKRYLNELISAYLLKDILSFEGIRNSSKMINILRMIAFQLGKEVSLEEVGRHTGLSRNTVERYLDLLSKVFIVFKLPGFSKNLRSEITKTSRWYFFDNGIRNALIANFNPLSLRNDTGELWENYVIAERIKFQQYTDYYSANYFWRTYQQQEIDWIEEMDGRLHAYEIKYNTHKKAKVPTAWAQAYPEASFDVINPENYLDWIQLR